MRAAWAVLLAGLGAAAPAGETPDRQLAGMEREVRTLMGETAALLAEADAAASAMAARRDLERVLPRRDALLGDLRSRLERLKQLEDDYDDLRRVLDQDRVLAGLGRVLNENRSEGMDRAISASGRRQAFSDGLSDFRHGAEVRLEAEARAFAGLQEGLATWRLTRWAAGAASVLFALTALVVLRRGRQRAP